MLGEAVNEVEHRVTRVDGDVHASFHDPGIRHECGFDGYGSREGTP